ncbi:MAG: preprotein translocase subunit SecG [Tannerella sp.]|jgi:preprotein translocase subunit SecG|nr:preprotein translocase subunit SecG [Tannerella sp.]
MYVFFSVLILIASIFLILIVLVQNSKGGGLASGFSSSNQYMGVRKTTDFLEKATWGLAGGVAFFCIVITSVLPRHQNGAQPQSEIHQQVNDAMVDPNLLNNPNFGTAQPDAAPAVPVVPREEGGE